MIGFSSKNLENVSPEKIWQINVDNVEAAFKTHVVLVSPVSLGDICKYVVKKLTNGEMEKLYCLVRCASVNSYVDLSESLKIDKNIITENPDKAVKMLFDDMKKKIKDFAYKSGKIGSFFERLYRELFEKEYVNWWHIIGYTESEEKANAFKKLRNYEEDFWSDEEWEAHWGEEKYRKGYLRRKMTCLTNYSKDTQDIIVNVIARSSDSPFSGNNIVYNFLMEIEKENISLSEVWVKSLVLGMGRFNMILENPKGIDFNDEKMRQLIIFNKAYDINHQLNRSDFIPLLQKIDPEKKSQLDILATDEFEPKMWKTYEEMLEVWDNDGTKEELKVNGLTMREAYAKAEEKADEISRARNRAEMIREEQAKAAQAERTAAAMGQQQREANRAMCDSQIAILEAKKEELKLRLREFKMSDPRYGDILSQISSIEMQIKKLKSSR